MYKRKADVLETLLEYDKFYQTKKKRLERQTNCEPHASDGAFDARASKISDSEILAGGGDEVDTCKLVVRNGGSIDFKKINKISAISLTARYESRQGWPQIPVENLPRRQ